MLDRVARLGLRHGEADLEVAGGGCDLLVGAGEADHLLAEGGGVSVRARRIVTLRIDTDEDSDRVVVRRADRHGHVRGHERAYIGAAREPEAEQYVAAAKVLVGHRGACAVDEREIDDDVAEHVA